jgi:hypothetical protein
MDILTNNPLAAVIFGVVFVALVIAAAGRLGKNVHDDIEDWQEERDAEEKARKTKE